MNAHDNVEWVVKYLSYPAPTIVWRDKYGNQIPWSTDKNKESKMIANRDSQSTTLKIRNVNLDDCAYYSLHIKNDWLPEKVETFHLKCKTNEYLQAVDVEKTTTLDSKKHNGMVLFSEIK